MSTLRRALALAACAAALSSAAGPAVAASHGGHRNHAQLSHAQVAKVALNRLLAGHAYDGIRLDPSHVVTATVCFHGACATKRLQPEPTCDPSGGACVGTALRAWRPNRVTTIEAELL